MKQELLQSERKLKSEYSFDERGGSPLDRYTQEQKPGDCKKHHKNQIKLQLYSHLTFN